VPEGIAVLTFVEKKFLLLVVCMFTEINDLICKCGSNEQLSIETVAVGGNCLF
jgi:hypothetical protein